MALLSTVPPSFQEQNEKSSLMAEQVFFHLVHLRDSKKTPSQKGWIDYRKVVLEWSTHHKEMFQRQILGLVKRNNVIYTLSK